jgi:hypothetical protein
MTIQLVPVDATGLQTYFQTTTFEGTSYVLAFQYNQRCASWYLSVADALGVDIYNGVKLVCGIPLLRKCRDPRRPPGELIVLSSTADTSPPALIDLYPASGRCQLLYVTSDWLALLAQGQVATILAQLQANTQTSSTSTYGQE